MHVPFLEIRETPQKKRKIIKSKNKKRRNLVEKRTMKKYVSKAVVEAWNAAKRAYICIRRKVSSVATLARHSGAGYANGTTNSREGKKDARSSAA